MTFLLSFIISITIVLILSLIFKEESRFWLDKAFGRFRRKKKTEKEKPEKETGSRELIKKYCGFRNFSEKEKGEICTIFQLEDGSEYFVTEDKCRECQVWDRYEEWLESGKKEDLKVTLASSLSGSKPMVIDNKDFNPEAERGLKFDDFVVKRKRVPWAGKAVIAVLTLFTYLVVHFSGIFNTPIVRAMPDEFYFYDVGDKAYANNWNMRTTDPASAADTSTRCSCTGTNCSSNYCALYPGVSRNSWEASYSGPKKRGWMTDNDDLLNGTIAAGTWTVYGKYNYVDNGAVFCTALNENLQYKIWKGDTNLDNRTVIHNWDSLCAPTEGVHTCSDSFSPGAVEFSNEVILIEFRFYETVGKFCPDPNDISNYIQFYVDEGSSERLTTPVYSPVPEKSLYFAVVMPFIPIAIKKFRLRKYFKKSK